MEKVPIASVLCAASAYRLGSPTPNVSANEPCVALCDFKLLVVAAKTLVLKLLVA